MTTIEDHSRDVETQAENSSHPSLLEVRDLSFIYPNTEQPALQNVDLKIERGEFVILTGASGSGKSTLCRHLNGIVPHLSLGDILSGEVWVAGNLVEDTPVYILSTHVGMVHQNPEDQIVSLNVRDELAFGPENLGLSHEEIIARVDEVVRWVGLASVMDMLTFECSGGQKQRVAIGSSLALYPDLLVLDEPTTDLDPVAAQEVIAALLELRDHLGLSILVIEHDLDELLEVADRLVVMDHGQVVMDGPPTILLNERFDELVTLGLRIPAHIEIARHLVRERGSGEAISLRKQDIARNFDEWVRAFPENIDLSECVGRMSPSNISAPPAVLISNLSFSYDGLTDAVDEINLSIQPGEFVALVGQNGSGKSTLARLIMGLMKPDQGKISLLGMDPTKTAIEDLSTRVGYLFQNPDSQLFNFSVESEIAFGMKLRKASEDKIRQRVNEVLALLALEHLRERHPFSLSRGERQRLALATVLVVDPDVILLDEPTTGQDRKNLDNLLQLMRDWIERKRATVVMITHDMDLVFEYADRVIVMAEGRVICDGPVEQVFYDNYKTLRAMHLLPPTICQFSYPLVPDMLPRMLTTMREFHWLFDQAERNHPLV